MKNCPFCGGKIREGVEQCEHCDKTLRKQKTDSPDNAGLTDLESWKQKTVPSWVMYLLVGLALFCVWLMFAQGCEKGTTDQLPQDKTALRLPKLGINRT